MDYAKLYTALVSHRKTNILLKSKDLYTENHHIIPRCLGGSNKIENLVRLTGREHYIAHRFLSKIYPNNIRLTMAALFMSRRRNNYISSKEYHKLRCAHAKFVSDTMTGKVVSEETRRKASIAKIGKMIGEDNPFYGRTHTEEVKAIISSKNKGRESPNEKGKPRNEVDTAKIRATVLRGESHPMKKPEVAKRHSDKMKGKKFSEEHKDNMSMSASAPLLVMDTDGNIFVTKGMGRLCRKYNLSDKMIANSADLNGQTMQMNINVISEKALNTVGWACERISLETYNRWTGDRR